MYQTLSEEISSPDISFNIMENGDSSFNGFDSEDNEETNCIICLTNDPGIINMADIKDDKIIKRCVCNAPVHLRCVKVWYKKSGKCLICHKKVLIRGGNVNPTPTIRNRRRRNDNACKKLSCNAIIFIIIGSMLFYFWIIQNN